MEQRDYVYVVVGWFGDVEWIENIYGAKEHAESACDKLWETRVSEIGPEHTHGVAKFAVERFPVR